MSCSLGIQSNRCLNGLIVMLTLPIWVSLTNSTLHGKPINWILYKSICSSVGLSFTFTPFPQISRERPQKAEPKCRCSKETLFHFSHRNQESKNHETAPITSVQPLAYSDIDITSKKRVSTTLSCDIVQPFSH
jgi:hypothetical protein